jgi:hypothetical protein
MSVVDKIKALYGIECFLRKFDIPVNIKKDKHINQIFLEFAKEMNWLNEFAKQNKPNYRGNYKPSYSNAELIQANFKDFSNYIHKTYKKLN